MNLFSDYDKAIAEGKIENNEQQRALLPVFQNLVDALEKPEHRWFKWQKSHPQGIYLHGSVGAGKTFLMDLFYKHLQLHGRGKLRLHFHHFMQEIDGQLRRLQGKKNPLTLIAAQFAKTTRVLCLDEMLVNDIAHAMILAEFFTHLFKNGIVLVATSNTAPDDLYRNGIQRARFLPVIHAIKTECTILELTLHHDFRMHHKLQYQTYLYPLSAETESLLNQQFESLGGTVHPAGEMLIQNRLIAYRKYSEFAIWFDFDQICDLPRSQLDYLELVQKFSTIIVSNIPLLNTLDSAKTILFVNFIDVLYDQKTRLIASAAVPLEALFGPIKDKVKRSYSRLQEMQSVGYSHCTAS